MTLDEYLLIRFIRSNHPKYRKYAVYRPYVDWNRMRTLLKIKGVL